jgi:hypothetical protein
LSTAIDLIRWARGGVLRDWTGRVRWHVLKDPTHPVDDVVVINLAAGHPRRVALASVLVAEGVASHQRLHPPLHKAEGHMLGP